MTHTVDHTLRAPAINQILAAQKDGWDLQPIVNYISALEAIFTASQSQDPVEDRIAEIRERADLESRPGRLPRSSIADLREDRAYLLAELAASQSRERAISAQLSAMQAERDETIRQRDGWHSNFQVLERAVVGETGGSAIETATSLRAERDRMKEALRREVILNVKDGFRCAECDGLWLLDADEKHELGCLAALTTTNDGGGK